MYPSTVKIAKSTQIYGRKLRGGGISRWRAADRAKLAASCSRISSLLSLSTRESLYVYKLRNGLHCIRCVRSYERSE